MNKYTVIGFYEDNGQAFITHVEAGNADQAVIAARAETDSPSTLNIITVIDGHHRTYDI